MHAGPSNSRALTLSPAGPALNEDAPAGRGDVTVCWAKALTSHGKAGLCMLTALLPSRTWELTTPPPGLAAGSFLFSFVLHLICLGIACVIRVSIPSIVQREDQVTNFLSLLSLGFYYI